MSNKPRFYMLVGVPGSGKSTFIKKFMSTDFVILSTDDFIEQKAAQEKKTYSQVFQRYIKAATQNLNQSLLKAIQEKKSIIWDQTNLTVANRKKKLDQIPDFYEKIAVYFKIPHDLKERLASRPGKNIPDDVMKNMINTIEKPSKNEGFSQIIEI